MEFTTPSLIVMVKRSEMEKTPKIAYAHEVPVLQALHGKNRIEVSDAVSPFGDVMLDAEVEFQRLLDEYKAPEGRDHPALEVYDDLDGFIAAVGKKKPGRKAAEQVE